MNRKSLQASGKGIVLIFSLALMLLASGSVSAAAPLVLDKTVLDRDAVWQGEVLLKGDVEVPVGVTLIIMPGTTVRFALVEKFGPAKLSKDKLNHFPGLEIIVRGKILAQGTPEKKIVFTSAAETPAPGDWGAVNMLASVDNIIEYCEFSYAHTAVHGHSAHAVISHCDFHHNGVAIGQKNIKKTGIVSVMPIMYNRITENGGGVLYGGGSTPSVIHNEISNNEFFGIYAKKSGLANIRYNNIVANGKGVIIYVVKAGMLLRDNNIADNTDYNISLLEGQKWDVNARHNWWGVTGEERIRALIRDRERDETLGRIDAADFFTAPVAGAGLPAR